VECRVGKRSDDGDRGVWNEFVGSKSRPRSAYPVEQLIYAEHHRKGGRYRVWNEIEALQIEVEEGIEEGPFERWSFDRKAVWSAE